MPQFLLISCVITLYVGVMLVRLKMNWLGIIPTAIFLVGYILIATFLSKTLIKRRQELLPFFRFKAIVVTVGLLFCSITSNVLLQLGQKQAIGHLNVGDSSKAAYEEQHGRAESVLGKQLTEEQANAFSQIKRVTHEFIGVVSEEVIYRWVILGALILVLPPGWSILISSLIFAALHLV
ncbi:MAG TPA: CPBP family intramembrane glutamic endopeptidase, partial [Oligoflexus sp.]|uniref:CPBP family intramembrane glutamic endopeptidase n=1 Tax=Oligoflexus sp. TaxID=1971216 RepID=UPI002D436E99